MWQLEWNCPTQAHILECLASSCGSYLERNEWEIWPNWMRFVIEGRLLGLKSPLPLPISSLCLCLLLVGQVWAFSTAPTPWLSACCLVSCHESHELLLPGSISASNISFLLWLPLIMVTVQYKKKVTRKNHNPCNYYVEMAI